MTQVVCDSLYQFEFALAWRRERVLAQIFGGEVWQGSLVLIVMMLRAGRGLLETVDHSGQHGAALGCSASRDPFKHLQLAL